MAKQKKTDEDIFRELAEMSGGKVLTDEPPVKYYIDTGNLALNWACSGKFLKGGIPGGRITELIGPAAGGKCVDEDMEVILSDGRLEKIGNIVHNKDNTPIVSFNEDAQRFETFEVSDFWDNGLKDCWECTTRSGRIMVTTNNHEYLTPEGWKYLEDIRSGDFIATAKELPYFGDIRLSDSLVKFLAYMLSEGSCTVYKSSSSCNFTNTDDDIIKDFLECCKDLGVNVSQYKSRFNLSNNARPILRKYGVMGSSAKTKVIPEGIFTCPKDQVALFLRIFFSCDGSIPKSKDGRRNIELTLASEKMLRQISHLLARFGIVHNLRYKLSKCNGKKFDAWRINIRSKEYINLFLKDINFISFKKTSRLNCEVQRSIIDKFPGAVATRFYNDLKVEMGARTKERYFPPKGELSFHSKFGRKKAATLRYSVNKGQCVMRESFSPAKGTMTYDKYIGSHIMWDEVISIKYVGKRHTFDLTVPKNHNFVANDCVIHNSLIGTNVVRGTQAINGIPVYLDTENTLNPEFAVRVSKIDPGQMIHITPKDGIDCLERTFLKIFNIIRKFKQKFPDKPLCFIYDTISVSPSERELRETEISEKFTEAEWKKVVGRQEQPGERAKICNKEFRKLEMVLEKNDVSMLVVNQIRQKIGSYGNPEVSAAAATVLEFHASCRLRTSSTKKIENKKLGKIIGTNMKVKCIKNKTSSPFCEVEGIQLFFEKGVNPLSGLLTALIQSERIESVSPGNYKVKEPWANGKEIKFKASKERNTVEAQLLFDCPGLIDASNEEEVKNYLAIFQSALDQTMAPETEEKDLISESEELI